MAGLAIQDTINANSARTAKFFFNTLFDIESIANFYAMSFSFSLACYYSKKCKNLTMEDNISHQSDDLAPRQKWEIIRYIRPKKSY